MLPDSPYYPWPFAPQSEPGAVAFRFHSVQVRPKTSLPWGGSYFHGGVDIVMPVGTPVLAVASGSVKIYRDGRFDNIILTEASGDRWEYRHVQIDSTPSVIREAATIGARIPRGAVLGTVPPWGLGYNHIHLNRRSSKGCILNPLDALIPISDTKPPQIIGVHFLAQGQGGSLAPDARGVVEVAGPVDVVVDAIGFCTTRRPTCTAR